jgi:hypothetical protein
MGTAASGLSHLAGPGRAIDCLEIQQDHPTGVAGHAHGVGDFAHGAHHASILRNLKPVAATTDGSSTTKGSPLNVRSRDPSRTNCTHCSF